MWVITVNMRENDSFNLPNIFLLDDPDMFMIIRTNVIYIIGVGLERLIGWLQFKPEQWWKLF